MLGLQQVPIDTLEEWVVAHAADAATRAEPVLRIGLQQAKDEVLGGGWDQLEVRFLQGHC